MNELVRKTLPEWRLERGDMTQQDLAVKAGLYATTISGIETGRTRPSFDTMRAIADALGILVDQIIWPESRPGAPRKRRSRGGGRPSGEPSSGNGRADPPPTRGDTTDGAHPKAQARPAA